MPKRKQQPPIESDLAVRKEAIHALFHPRIARSTFFKKVEEGVIVRCRAVSGYYLLNATRRNLALPLVDPEAIRRRQRREAWLAVGLRKRLTLAAMAKLVPSLPYIYPPDWFPGLLTDEEAHWISRVTDRLRGVVEEQPTLQRKLAVVGGILRAEEVTRRDSLAIERVET